MDENNLIYLFVGKLNINNSASSDTTPAPTAGCNGANSGSGSATTRNGKMENDSLTREMIDNVATFKKTVDVVASTDIRRQIDVLKDKVFDLEDQIMQFDDIDLEAVKPKEKKRYERLKRRLDDVNQHIIALEGDMGGLTAAPK